MIKVKSTLIFPSRIIDGPGVDVERQNGNWNVSLDFSQLAAMAPYTAQSNHYVVVFDAVAGNYFLVPATSL